MKIVSLDQSSRYTGYAVYEDNKLIHWGLIDLHKESNINQRYISMCNGIDNVLITFAPDVVVFEDVSLRQSIKTLIQLSRLQGSIIYMTTSKGIDYHIYAPTQWRGIVGIKQGSTIKRPKLKKEAIDFVKKIYGIDINDDIAESVCIGLAYLIEKNLITQI